VIVVCLKAFYYCYKDDSGEPVRTFMFINIYSTSREITNNP